MSVWNNQAIVDLLGALWDEGRTGTEIAQTIEIRFGVLLTRNSVMAKLHRLGKLGARGGVGSAGTSKAQKEARRRKAAKTMAAKAEVAVVPVAKPEPEPVKAPKGWFSMQNKPVEVKPYVEKQARVFDPKKLVTFDELEGHHCRWPIGDPRDSAAFRFCGEHKVIGLPYCGKCSSVAFQPREVAPSRGVTARPVVVAAGGQTEKIRPDVATDNVPAAGEALAEEMEEA